MNIIKKNSKSSSVVKDFGFKEFPVTMENVIKVWMIEDTDGVRTFHSTLESAKKCKGGGKIVELVGVMD
jgi:hypothetical protein